MDNIQPQAPNNPAGDDVDYNSAPPVDNGQTPPQADPPAAPAPDQQLMPPAPSAPTTLPDDGNYEPAVPGTPLTGPVTPPPPPPPAPDESEVPATPSAPAQAPAASAAVPDVSALKTEVVTEVLNAIAPQLEKIVGMIQNQPTAPVAPAQAMPGAQNDSYAARTGSPEETYDPAAMKKASEDAARLVQPGVNSDKVMQEPVWFDRRYPVIRGGKCEYCGIDYRKCPHYKKFYERSGQPFGCLCGESAKGDPLQSQLNLLYLPHRGFFVCDSAGCANRYIDEFKGYERKVAIHMFHRDIPYQGRLLADPVLPNAVTK